MKWPPAGEEGNANPLSRGKKDVSAAFHKVTEPLPLLSTIKSCQFRAVSRLSSDSKEDIQWAGWPQSKIRALPSGSGKKHTPIRASVHTLLNSAVQLSVLDAAIYWQLFSRHYGRTVYNGLSQEVQVCFYLSHTLKSNVIRSEIAQ